MPGAFKTSHTSSCIDFGICSSVFVWELCENRIRGHYMCINLVQSVRSVLSIVSVCLQRLLIFKDSWSICCEILQATGSSTGALVAYRPYWYTLYWFTFTDVLFTAVGLHVLCADVLSINVQHYVDVLFTLRFLFHAHPCSSSGTTTLGSIASPKPGNAPKKWVSKGSTEWVQICPS